MIVPLARLVVTSAPGTLPTLPARDSTASGVNGSDPGRSLASGLISIGLPVSPAITSGSAVGATGWRSSGCWTRKSSVSLTGSPSPSVTPYSTRTGPPCGGARKRTAPEAVTRDSPLAAGPPPTSWAETVETGSPSFGSRQSGSTGTSMVPPAGTVQTRGSKPMRSRGSALGWPSFTMFTRTVLWADTDWRPSSMKYSKLVLPAASPGKVIWTVWPSGLIASCAPEPSVERTVRMASSRPEGAVSLSSGCRIVVRPGRAPRLSFLAFGGRRSPWFCRSSSSSSSSSSDSRLKASQLSRRVGLSESMSQTRPVSRSLRTI